jgi:CRP/FNR family transcriptional regulator, nitrogen fixation regulation protein
LINIHRTILAAAKLQIIELSFSGGESVYERGAPAHFVYVVDTGALCRLRQISEDRRSVLGFLFPGDGFGFEVGRHHRDTAQALIRTKLLAVSRQALLAAAKSNARLSNLLFSAAANAVVVAEERADILRVRTVTEKMAQFLLEMEVRLSVRGKIDLSMRRRDIADHFGLSIETVSRTLSAFEREKIIQFQHGSQRQLVIRDKQRLEQLASGTADFDSLTMLNRRSA